MSILFLSIAAAALLNAARLAWVRSSVADAATACVLKAARKARVTFAS